MPQGKAMTDYSLYQSPYTWRYGHPEISKIWSESHKREIWRLLWVALAEAQLEFGLVKAEQVKDLKEHVGKIDISRSLAIEKRLKHDLMAEIMTYAEQCPIGGGIIHLGATSVDIKDNAIALQCKESLHLILEKLERLLLLFAEKIEQYADFPIIAFTHLQPAEPSTLGYRLAQYAQDLFSDWQTIRLTYLEIKGKGFKGAVGTSASYAELIGLENIPKFESILSEKLGISFFKVTTQTYPRKQEYEMLNSLAGMAAVLYKFAFDLRFLQSPPIGELSEPFAHDQVGSSAMPFKRNPVQCETIDSLARWLAQFPRTAWDNAAHSLLERTLDDSANRRTILPEAFLITDELLSIISVIIQDLFISETSIAQNLNDYGPFAATERLLMVLAKQGADRQEMHSRLRSHSLTAWKSIQRNEANPLCSIVSTDPVFLKFLPENEIRSLMDANAYIGDAPRRARDLASDIRGQLANH